MNLGLLYTAQRAKLLSRMIRSNPVGREIWNKDLQSRLIEVINTADRVMEGQDDPVLIGRLKQLLGEVQVRMLRFDLKSSEEKAFGKYLMETLSTELGVSQRKRKQCKE